MPLNRRRFLTETGRLWAAASLGPALLNREASRARGAPNASPNQRIVCAAIGVGGRGRYLMSLAAKQKDVVVATVCDANKRNLARAAEEVGKIQGRPAEQIDTFD